MSADDYGGVVTRLTTDEEIIAAALTGGLGLTIFAERPITDDGAVWDPEAAYFPQPRDAAVYVAGMRKSGFRCWFIFTDRANP